MSQSELHPYFIVHHVDRAHEHLRLIVRVSIENDL
jgi:hypothetical protein